MTRNVTIGWSVALLVALAACDTSTNPDDAGMGGGTAAQGGGEASGGGAATGGGGGTGGGAADAGQSDGTPIRQPCSSQYGTSLTGTFGRLDGLVVSLVPGNTTACFGDPSHLHMQILMNAELYDVAVNLDALELEIPAALPGGAWSDGWHTTAALDYVGTLQVHSDQFVAHTVAETRSLLETRLAATNHISVFATRYNGGDGAHLVHRNSSSHDGALVLEPLSGDPHFVMFRFANQTF